MAPDQESTQLNLGYEIFIALISILSVFNMVLAVIPGIDPAAVHVVFTINLFLTLLFIFDFGLRLCTAASRSFYFIRDYGWADLLAIIPFFRILRVFRIFKTYRLVHKQGAKNLIGYLTMHRAEAALFILVFAVIIIIELGSFMVLVAESVSPDANIVTSGDAMWWTYVTITTVGYGDRYPVTEAGRLIGILVMTTGVGIFATFAGYIGNKLLAPPEREQRHETVPDLSPPAAVTLAELRQYLEQREKIDAEISTRLARLERQVQGETTPSGSGPAA
ncbi:MAG: ion transporter [Methanomicrobiales archaeon]|nr:ion transporter [Methanomicrobiales archaeon]